mgnify:CR=1 FL=1
MRGSFYEVVIYFMLYSFIGWLLEVAYAFYKERRFVNRGFLAGPLCPIYGFGTLLILNISSVLKFQHPSLLTNAVFIVLLTSALEYLTGYVLETFLHMKAWDYSNEFFNLNGRVCLKFSLFWGLLGCFVIYGLHPIVVRYVETANEDMKILVSFALLGCVLADTAKAVLPRIDFIKQIKAHVRVSLPLHIFKI